MLLLPCSKMGKLVVRGPTKAPKARKRTAQRLRMGKTQWANSVLVRVIYFGGGFHGSSSFLLSSGSQEPGGEGGDGVAPGQDLGSEREGGNDGEL